MRDNKQKSKMGKSGKKCRLLDLLGRLISWFGVEAEKEKSGKARPLSRPEATMIAASKHFSTAHKVRLI